MNARVRGARLVAAVAAAVLAAGCAIPRWPVDPAPVTSAFGVRWTGILPDVHRGIDLGVPEGTPVRAMSGGRVAFAGPQGAYGNAIWIDHGGRVWTLYAHLSRIDVATGRDVGPGQLLGLSGATGEVSGPHLHFEVWRWGRPVDPVPLLGRPPR
jgi:murein DD-endopeptidase MepM/ murein hydrolase activator NlpD